MKYSEWETKRDELDKQGVMVGDTLTTADGGQAKLRLCQFSGRVYIPVILDIVADLVNGPRFVLVSNKRFRGKAMKLFVNTQRLTDGVLAVRVTRKSPRSAMGKIVSMTLERVGAMP